MSVVAGRLDASKSPHHGPEVCTTLDDLRVRAARGEVIRVNAATLLELIEERNRLRDDVDGLRSAMAPTGTVDGASP